MKKVLGIMMLLLAFNGTAQDTKSRTATINIQTSAVCGMCKDRIEEKLNYTKGVVFAELNLDDKILTVRYKTKVISSDQIRKVISKTGYHADDLIRDLEAFNNLPGCCRDKNAECTKKK
jgi:mercuric ion binding protein